MPDTRTSRRSIVLTALATLAACAGKPASTSPTPSGYDGAVIDSAVTYARTLFHQAIGSADTLSLQAVLDSDVTITVRGETVVRGASAVAIALAGNRDGTGSSMRMLASSEPELCEGSAITTGEYSLRHSEDGKLLGLQNGGYAMHLKVAGYAAKIDDIVLDAGPSEARRASSKPCYLLASRQFFRRRFEFSFSPISVATSTTNSTLEKSLAGAGWTRSAANLTWNLASVEKSESKDGQFHGQGGGEDAILPRANFRIDDTQFLFFTAAFRVSDALRIEGKTQVGQSGGQLMTYRADLQSRLTQKFNTRSSSVQFVGSWGGLRAGVGPNFATMSATERYEKVDATGNPIFASNVAVKTDSSWTHHSTGIDTQLGYAYPISSYVFGYLSLRSQFLTNTQFSGVPTHQSWIANLSGAQVALSFGIAY